MPTPTWISSCVSIWFLCHPPPGNGCVMKRLETLGEHDPDRGVWETNERQQMLSGVRVLLRVARAGVGHASECVRVADQVCDVLNSLWATDHNRLTVREVSDELFDQVWDTGVMEAGRSGLALGLFAHPVGSSTAQGRQNGVAPVARPAWFGDVRSALSDRFDTDRSVG